MILQHPFHDEIRSDKHMPVHALAWLAVQRSHRYPLLHHRHMAVLASLLSRVVAMLPLLERHLLRELRQLLTLWPERCSVQRMATPAKTCIAHMVAPGWEVRRGRGVHHGLVPFVDVEGPILRPQVVSERFRDPHTPDECKI